MTYPRKSLVCLEATPYYHVIARCVRRAWLWGFDEYAGRDYSHRKNWLIERLQRLSDVFAIDVCAYAVMSNHYHLVVRVDRARAFSDQDVVARWSMLFRLPSFVQRWREGVATEVEADAAAWLIREWRGRLTDLSWYMRCLNEHLARRANAEDQCSGRFWEGRFTSRALLDEAGLLTAMAYVDLNPVRAGIAHTPEDSEFTSIYERCRSLPGAQKAPSPHGISLRRVGLLAFCDESAKGGRSLPMTLNDYLELLDWSGRMIRTQKGGAIDTRAPHILTRLSINPDEWKAAMRTRCYSVGRALGSANRLRELARALGQRRIHGIQRAERLFGAA